MDFISQLIKNNKLEEAKAEIKSLEQKLSETQSTHASVALKKIISKLKKEFIQKQKVDLSTISVEPRKQFPDKEIVIPGNDNKLDIVGLKNNKMDFLIAVEAKITNCEQIFIKYLKCEKSAVFINVKNSEINCEAEQIRLIDCENMRLNASAKTGVFLQNSKGIVIRKKADNEYLKENFVFDFSAPFDSRNYELIED